MEESHVSPEKSAVQKHQYESASSLIQVPLFWQKSGGQEGAAFSQCVPRNSGWHWHTNAESLTSIQSPLFKQGALSQGRRFISHWAPVHPSGQSQWNVRPTDRHCPEFLQGLGEQKFSENVKEYNFQLHHISNLLHVKSMNQECPTKNTYRWFFILKSLYRYLKIIEIALPHLS